MATVEIFFRRVYKGGVPGALTAKGGGQTGGLGVCLLSSARMSHKEESVNRALVVFSLFISVTKGLCKGHGTTPIVVMRNLPRLRHIS